MDESVKEGMPDIRTYSPLTLAFIGDAVFSLYIRTIVVKKGNAAPGKLHEACSELVQARTQSRMILSILEELSGEEKTVYRRGRNAQAPSRAKHASMSEYRHATGLEALFGYLYLTGKKARMGELVELCLKCYERDQAKGKFPETGKGQRERETDEKEQTGREKAEDKQTESEEAVSGEEGL